jgi:hypothetical protein
MNSIGKIKEDGRIYWANFGTSVMFLIPKKKGTGFLKVPVGHHVNSLSRFITDLGYDCDGLDGYLNVWTGSTYGKDEEVAKLVSDVAELYSLETIQVSGDSILNYCIVVNKTK